MVYGLWIKILNSRRLHYYKSSACLADSPFRDNGWRVYCTTLYLCEYTILSVVLLQDVLEGQLDLLLEFFHFHLLLKPRPICRNNDHKCI